MFNKYLHKYLVPLWFNVNVLRLCSRWKVRPSRTDDLGGRWGISRTSAILDGVWLNHCPWVFLASAPRLPVGNRTDSNHSHTAAVHQCLLSSLDNVLDIQSDCDFHKSTAWFQPPFLRSSDCHSKGSVHLLDSGNHNNGKGTLLCQPRFLSNHLRFKFKDEKYKYLLTLIIIVMLRECHCDKTTRYWGRPKINSTLWFDSTDLNNELTSKCLGNWACCRREICYQTKKILSTVLKSMPTPNNHCL